MGGSDKPSGLCVIYHYVKCREMRVMLQWAACPEPSPGTWAVDTGNGSGRGGDLEEGTPQQHLLDGRHAESLRL